MIKRLKVEELNGKISCDLAFNPDLNIITGKNGSGKTTLLKLIWYLISGNLERIFPEMTFKSVLIETDSFTLAIYHKNRQNSKTNKNITNYEFDFSGGDTSISKEVHSGGHSRNNFTSFIDLLNDRIAPLSDSSVFFPTFRRIEGGFSLNEDTPEEWHYRSISARPPQLEEAMRVLSERISVQKHRFVSSISTQDIVRLLTSKYADVSELTNLMHSRLSSSIIERINEYSSVRSHGVELGGSNPDDVLQAIKRQVDEVSFRRDELLRPFSVLSDLINLIFKEKAISVNEGVILGDAAEAISSDKLSAGEKQMLSFLCYNAFYSNIPVFIDEPELSLHTDWQRMLFPTLLKQDTKNQFIIATHSPFIYSKYPDKELVLDQDRGGEL